MTHGTAASYKKGKCRDECCLSAAREAKRRWRAGRRLPPAIPDLRGRPSMATFPHDTLTLEEFHELRGA